MCGLFWSKSGLPILYINTINIDRRGIEYHVYAGSNISLQIGSIMTQYGKSET